MATSQNGWKVHTTSAGVTPLRWITGRVDPRVHDLFDALCARYAKEVEPITRAHSWGWANRDIRGSTQVSNHASGTAIDLNAPAHPMGKSGTFTAKQVKAIRAILRDFPQVRWGGDYAGRKDEMHWEINVPASKITGGTVSSTMVSPLEGRYTSAYNPNRYITYKGKRVFSPHRGTDIAPPTPGTTGLAVRAAFAGTVKKAVSWAKPGNASSTWAPGRTGNGVLVANPDGEGQGYNHTKPSVKEGQKVKAGDVVGHLDRSGQQTGPHLHFETWANWRNPDSAFDPAVLFKKYKIGIGSAPKIGTTTTPPKPKKEEYFDMDKKTFENGLDAAFKRNAEYLVRKMLAHKMTVAGAMKRATGKDQANISTMLRHAASISELRNFVKDFNSRMDAQDKALVALGKEIAKQGGLDEKAVASAMEKVLKDRLPATIEIPLSDLDDE